MYNEKFLRHSSFLPPNLFFEKKKTMHTLEHKWGLKVCNNFLKLHFYVQMEDTTSLEYQMTKVSKIRDFNIWEFGEAGKTSAGYWLHNLDILELIVQQNWGVLVCKRALEGLIQKEPFVIVFPRAFRGGIKFPESKYHWLLEE